MSRSIQFEIETGYRTVFITYSEEITTQRQRAIHDSLFYSLRDLRGVESVEQGRYSTRVKIAPHIASEAQVANTIFDSIFTDDSELSELLSTEYGDWEAEVEALEDETEVELDEDVLPDEFRLLDDPEEEGE